MKTIGRKWNMRHEFAADILGPCNNQVKYVVSISRVARGEQFSETFYVCGVHKNAILARAKKFGWPFNVELYNPDISEKSCSPE